MHTKQRTFLLLAIACLLAGCQNHGDKVKAGHVDVFYRKGVSEAQAAKTAQLLYDADVLINRNTKARKSVQLDKKNDTFYFRMVVIQSKLASIKDEHFHSLGSIISDSVFEGGPVNVDLTDNHFKTLRTIRFKRVDYRIEDSKQTDPRKDSVTLPVPAADQ
jgi:hypothetical protein